MIWLKRKNPLIISIRGFLIEFALYFVGMAGFEPTTSCSQSRRDTGLRYIPNLVSSFLKPFCEGIAKKQVFNEKNQLFIIFIFNFNKNKYAYNLDYSFSIFYQLLNVNHLLEVKSEIRYLHLIYFPHLSSPHFE